MMGKRNLAGTNFRQRPNTLFTTIILFPCIFLLLINPITGWGCFSPLLPYGAGMFFTSSTIWSIQKNYRVKIFERYKNVPIPLQYSFVHFCTTSSSSVHTYFMYDLNSDVKILLCTHQASMFSLRVTFYSKMACSSSSARHRWTKQPEISFDVDIFVPIKRLFAIISINVKVSALETFAKVSTFFLLLSLSSEINEKIKRQLLVVLDHCSRKIYTKFPFLVDRN